jgi:DMSO/TMAO reductase YedYZ molybdopterin-dependent catalytic subunit
MVTRGFTGRQSGSELSDVIPTGQHLVDNFPVLTAEPTPRIDPPDWTFMLKIGSCPVKAWSWSEFYALPRTQDDTRHPLRDLVVEAQHRLGGRDRRRHPRRRWPYRTHSFALAHCYDGYSTVPLADFATGKAMVALKYEGQPLPRDHWRPARLLVPHLYFLRQADRRQDCR